MKKGIRNRIVGLQTIDIKKIEDNPFNWRVHPEEQMTILRAALEDVGIVGVPIVRKISKDRFQLIDGHLRKKIFAESDIEGMKIQAIVVDLNDEEAKKAIATFDKIGGLAEIDEDVFNKLVESIAVENEELKKFLKKIEEGSIDFSTILPDSPNQSEDFGFAISFIADSASKRDEAVDLLKAAGFDPRVTLSRKAANDVG